MKEVKVLKTEKEEIAEAPVTMEESNIINDKFAVVSGCTELRLREAPRTDAEVITMLPEGTELELLANENMIGDFVKVCTSSGVEGFCMEKYLTYK